MMKVIAKAGPEAKAMCTSFIWKVIIGDEEGVGSGRKQGREKFFTKNMFSS